MQIPALLSPPKALCTFIAALLLPAFGFAQNTSATRPNAFMGVAWGSSPEDALRILGTRAGVTVPEEVKVGDRVELVGGTFAGQPAEKWRLEFIERKFCSVTVLLKPEKGATGLYRDLKQMLSGKYGPATGERKPEDSSSEEKKRNRNKPDEKTFGNVVYWRFSPTLADKERKTIEVELAGPDGRSAQDETTLVLTVRYTNDSLRPGQSSSGSSRSEPNRPIKADDL